MSSRRAARAALTPASRLPAHDHEGRAVAVLRSGPGEPVWRDVDALREVFGDLVDGRVESRLRMGGRVDGRITDTWAVAHGFESTASPGTVDWRALRAFLEGDER